MTVAADESGEVEIQVLQGGDAKSETAPESMNKDSIPSEIPESAPQSHFPQAADSKNGENVMKTLTGKINKINRQQRNIKKSLRLLSRALRTLRGALAMAGIQV